MSIKRALVQKSFEMSMFDWSVFRVIVLLAATAVVVVSPALAQPGGARGKDAGTACSIIRTLGSATSLAGCDFGDDAVDPVTRAREFIAAHAPEFKRGDLVAALQFLGSVKGLGTEHLRFQQTLGGYPILQALVSVHLDNRGHVRRMHNTFDEPVANAIPGRMNVDLTAATAIATQALARVARTPPANVAVQSARQGWYPRNDGVLVLVWELNVTAGEPVLDYRFLIDRTTGNVLLQQDQRQRWVTGSGLVFTPNPIQQSGDGTLTDASSAQYINSLRSAVTLAGLDGTTGLLRGRFVDASLQTAFGASLGPNADEANRQYAYDVADSRFGQVNAYFAVDQAQRFLRGRGYSSDRTVPNGIHDSGVCPAPNTQGPCPVKVYAHAFAADDSFYTPSIDAIRLGHGGVPDSEDADIIVHEYGHAIQHAQNPVLYVCNTSPSPYQFGDCEMKAMGEGFADFFAVVVNFRLGNTTYQQSNAACVGEWDSTAYQATPPYPPCLRRVDADYILRQGETDPISGQPSPIDVPNLYASRIGEVHYDGKIWSRALWDLQKVVGIDVALQIVIEHQYSLPADATMPDAALEMIAVDADVFGGYHEVPLRQAFCARGILTGPDCVMPASPRTLTFIANKDTLIRQHDPTRNEGKSPLLRLRGEAGRNTRVLVGFDLAAVDVSQVKSAMLEMRVAAVDQTWPNMGAPVDAYPMSLDFVQGNGVFSGADPSAQTPGTGSGSTWVCRSDTDISNGIDNCAPADTWAAGAPAGSPFPNGAATPPVVFTNWSASAAVRWNVTADVQAGISRWAIAKSQGDQPGIVDFYSTEGALALDPYDQAGRQPRLVITWK
jgi:Zn-dependent metalloprotease